LPDRKPGNSFALDHDSAFSSNASDFLAPRKENKLMVRSRFSALTVLSLVLAFTLTSKGRSEEKPKQKPNALPSSYDPLRGATFEAGNLIQLPAQETKVAEKTEKTELTCTVYALSDLGDDPNLGKWIAETIPEVIHPGTWNQAGASGEDKRVLSYYAPAKVMVVYHTPAVQTKVAAFLSNLKKTLPTQEEKATTRREKADACDPAVVPASYFRRPTKTEEPGSSPPLGYPVPRQAKQPKHLFHFIIRYEGEGIIDDTVAGVMKEIYGKKTATEEEPENKATPAVLPNSASLAPPPPSANDGVVTNKKRIPRP
jgi:hypothetical protein